MKPRELRPAELRYELFRSRKRAAKKIYKLQQYNNTLIRQSLNKCYSEDTSYKWYYRNAGALDFYICFRNDLDKREKFRSILKNRKWQIEPYLLFAEYQQKYSTRFGLLENTPPSFYNGSFSRRLP